MYGHGQLTNIVPDTENLENITMEKLEWLWPNRIPLGKITMLVGDPGLGKSFLSLDIAAHVSTGRPWPDDRLVPCSKGDILLITAEDDVADTIKPRLTAAGADMKKIHILRGMTGKWEGRNGEKTDTKMFFDLKKGIVALENLKEKHPDLRLVIIDPITAYMGDINSHDNAEVRSVLDKVADWAGRANIAVLAISHLNKNTNVGAKYRIMGSIAFTAVARMVWHVTEDKENPDRRLMLSGKMNVAENIGGLAFRLQSVKVGEELIDSAVLEWENKTVEQTAAEELEATIDTLSSTKKKTAEWLKDILLSGPVNAQDIYKAAEEDGISTATLNRAKKQLQVRSKRSEDGKVWEWVL